MNHDTVHCSDYRKSYCPRSCYYAKLTEDLRQTKKRRQLLGVPMSFDSFKDTDVCPRKGKRSADN